MAQNPTNYSNPGYGVPPAGDPNQAYQGFQPGNSNSSYNPAATQGMQSNSGQAYSPAPSNNPYPDPNLNNQAQPAFQPQAQDQGYDQNFNQGYDPQPQSFQPQPLNNNQNTQPEEAFQPQPQQNFNQQPFQDNYSTEYTDPNQQYSPAPSNNPYPDPNLNNQPQPAFQPQAQDQGYDQNFNQGYDPQPQSFQPAPNPNFDKNFGGNNSTFSNIQPQSQENIYGTVNDPYADPYAQQQPVGYQAATPDYSTQAPGGYADPSLGGGYDYGSDPAYDSATYDPAASTFEDKKSGSNLFLIIGGVIVLILLVATGVLFYLNNQDSGTPDTPSSTGTDLNSSQTLGESDSDSSESSTSSQTESSIASSTPAGNGTGNAGNDNLTGGSNTPATQARVNSENELPTSWLQQKFAGRGLDANGNCIQPNLCGEGADPDNDDMTNLEEYNFGTDPQNADTDGDGITDGNELYIYYSDPTQRDSDSDGVEDGQELIACLDPINTSTSKMNSNRLNDITSNVSFRPLRDATIQLLTTAGANNSDIDKGYIQTKCVNSGVNLDL